MQSNISWLKANHSQLIQDLADLVAIQSVSTDGAHQKEIGQSADLTCELMKKAGLNNVEILSSNDSNPYAYGEWIGDPKKPTIFLYAHHDVQPVHQKDLDAGRWHSDPWKLTARKGRLYGRGSADDKAAIVAQLGAVASYLKTSGSLPVNVKMLVEGEEEVGSKNLMGFFKKYKKKIQSDVIVVCDTENIDTGLPSLTYALRGIVALQVKVESSTTPVHSGMSGGMLADSAIALSSILARLNWGNKKHKIPGFYDGVRKLTKTEREMMKRIPGDEAMWRKVCGVLPKVSLANEEGVSPFEQTWRLPAVTVIAIEASSIGQASNQVLPRAEAIVSCRIVPDQDPDQVYKALKDYLEKDPPWGVKVTIEPAGNSVKWWMTDPTGPAFEAAMSAMKSGYNKDPLAIGCGGTIGFVGPLADLLGGAPALLFGIEDPHSNAHAPNESQHEGDLKKLMASLSYLFHNLGEIPGGKVK